MGLLKTITPYSLKKISFFTRVLDLNIMVNLQDVYELPWSTQWIKSVAENTLNNTPMMAIQVGSAHTMAINSKGKIFTWGWNHNGQCGKPF
jgi:alpha-tubulin suppressor-like RCC1 family protein